MELFIRENYLKKIRGFYEAEDLIKVITGVRRCGKSCLMQMIANELTQQGVSESNIIFLDLDRRGYRNIKTAADLENLILSKAISATGKNIYLSMKFKMYKTLKKY